MPAIRLPPVLSTAADTIMAGEMKWHKGKKPKVEQAAAA